MPAIQMQLQNICRLGFGNDVATHVCTNQRASRPFLHHKLAPMPEPAQVEMATPTVQLLKDVKGPPKMLRRWPILADTTVYKDVLYKNH